MNSPATIPTSSAVKASWASLALALGGTLVYLVVSAVSHIAPLGGAAGTVLSVLLAGQVFAVLTCIASFLLIREGDRTSKAVMEIVVRSVLGIVVGSAQVS